MLSNEQLAAIIEVGYEQRSTEFKSAGSRTDKAFLALVARAILALSNQRGGGHVIIGLSEKGIESEFTGLDETQLGEWMSYDDVSDQINGYADPPVSLQIRQGTLPNERLVVVVEVAEFGSIPTLCKKDFQGVLAAKQLYTRSMAKPASAATNSQNELREVLDLATEKQLARFIETSRRAGVDFGSADVRTAEAEFESQADLVEGHEGILAYEDAPHFLVTIHPPVFETRLIPYEELNRVLRSVAQDSTEARFPVIQDVQSGDDWIGGATQWTGHKEVWQYFQSGQFVEYKAIDDWEPDWAMSPPENVTQFLPLWLPLVHFTQALEFAARLQRTSESTPLQVSLSLIGIADRALVAANPRRTGLHGSYIYRDWEWKREVIMTPELAVTGARAAAVDLALDLLRRFQWDGATEEMLVEIQKELLP